MSHASCRFQFFQTNSIKMAKLSFIILSVLVAATSAFVPSGMVNSAQTTAAPKEATFALNMAEDTYWEG